MKESELLGKLLPGHPDISPIIENIREKYGIPPIDPENQDITELLLTNYEIDWEAVRQDIEEQVKNVTLFDDAAISYIQSLKKLRDSSLDFPEFDLLPEETANALKKLFLGLIEQSKLMLEMLDNVSHKPITDFVYEYLLTGKTRDVPDEWFGRVLTTNLLGKPVILVLAGEGSNPKELAEQFKSEFTKTFGKREYKITETQMSTAEYLAMSLQGNSLKRLVERYKEKHPSEFPDDTSSKEYRKAVSNQVDKIEKRLDRLEELIEKIAGDKN
jgi:hypothetical protein